MVKSVSFRFSLCLALLVSFLKTVPHDNPADKEILQNIPQSVGQLEPVDAPRNPQHSDAQQAPTQEEQAIRAEIAQQLNELLSSMQITVQQLVSGGRKLGSMKENKLLAGELSNYMAILKQIQETVASSVPIPLGGLHQSLSISLFETGLIQRLVTSRGLEALEKEVEACQQAQTEFLRKLTERSGFGQFDDNDDDVSLEASQQAVTHLNKHIVSLKLVFDSLGRSYYKEKINGVVKKLEDWKLRQIVGLAAGLSAIYCLSKCRTAYADETHYLPRLMHHPQAILVINELVQRGALPAAELQRSAQAEIGSHLAFLTTLTAGLGFLTTKIEAETGFMASLERLYQFVSNKARSVVGKTVDRLCGTYDETKQYGMYLDPMDHWKVHTTRTFEDVIGLEYVKAPLEKVISFINNPEAFTVRGLRPGNLMFTGKPRTGKSFIAECLAGEAAARNDEKSSFNYYSLPASDIMAFGIKEFLKLAATKAPCVLVIDEFDMLGLQRTSNTPLLADFLCGMSGCDQINSDKPMIIIAITNNPENLDNALRQKGRFDQEIRFLEPTLEDRFAFIAGRTHALGINLSQEELLLLAYETDGCVIEELEAMISSACVKSLLTKSYADFSALLDAYDYEVRRIMPNMPLKLTQKEQQIIAANQIGRAIAQSLMGNQERIISKVSILPTVTKVVEEHVVEQMGRPTALKQPGVAYGGTYSYPIEAGAGISSKQELERKCKECLAGFAAERVLYGSCGYSFDAQNKATAIYYARMLLGDGIPDQMRSEKQRDQLHDAAISLVQTYEEEMVQLLSEHKQKLQLLTDLLIALQEVNGSLLLKILEMDAQEATSLQERIKYVHAIRTELGRSAAYGVMMMPEQQFEQVKQELFPSQEEQPSDATNPLAALVS